MPWKETCPMDERMAFVVAFQSGEWSLSELCRRHGISRKTGYKLIERVGSEGAAGLLERSRRPHRAGLAMAPEIAEALLALRVERGWGPRKIKAWLEWRRPDEHWPAASTIGELYDRHGLTRPRRRRRRTTPNGLALAACDEPNAVWCIDFKGWIVTGSGERVDPLTLSDACSRFLLRCEAVARGDGAHVWPVLEAAFYEYGLPRVLRSDNGPPFASVAAGGLSRLAVRVIKAGVRPERIAPGQPQQNGRHERMHLTLKQAACTPPAPTLAQQVERFAQFRQAYNHERPHEALGQRPPASVYRPSPRPYNGILRQPDYPSHAKVRRVRHNGTIKWQGEEVFISEALAGEPVGLYETASQLHLVRYAEIPLGTLNGKQGFQPLGAGRSPRPKQQQNEPGKLSPMSPG